MIENKEELTQFDEIIEKEKQYIKGYNTAKKKYQAELKKLKDEHKHIIHHHVNTYPFCLIQYILEEHLSEEKQGEYDFSEKQILKAMSEVLTERENKILQLRYERKYTLEEVGKEFGVTRDRIRQIEVRAIRKLINPSNLKKMRVVSYAENLKLAIEYERLKIEYQKLIEERPNYDEYVKQEEAKLKHEIDLDKIGLSVRSYNCLKRRGIDTIRDLIDFIESGNKPSSIRNFGKRSLHEVKTKLKELGVEITNIHWK